jgi:hypothetical protein
LVDALEGLLLGVLLEPVLLLPHAATLTASVPATSEAAIGRNDLCIECSPAFMSEPFARPLVGGSQLGIRTKS